MSPHDFHTTRWNLVVQAGDGDHDRAQGALSELVESYWYPLYAFARQSGLVHDDAQDAIQGFFVLLLERRDFEKADPVKGRLRSYLIQALRNYLSKERDKDRTQKRGGDQTILSMDAGEANSRFQAEPFHELTPDKVFEKSWAEAVLERARDRLESDYSKQGKQKLFETLNPYLTGQVPSKTYGELSTELDMTETAIKVAVHRLRQRFGQCLRTEIAETLEDPRAVEEELQFLMEALS